VYCKRDQEDMDKTYHKLFTTLTNEMDNYLKYSDASKSIRKRLKNHKPYWNESLNELWLTASKLEKEYIKFKGSNNIKEAKRLAFYQARGIFDKKLRQAETVYNHKVLSELDISCKNNPREFWKFMKNLGPRKRSEILMKVYNENGELKSDIPYILNNWKDSFHNLYNKPNETISQENEMFYQNVMYVKETRESDMNNPEYKENPELNGPLSFDEIGKIINKLKLNKASGIDNIPNFVLTKHDVKFLLDNLFKKCFEYSILPTVWLKSVITPIPKRSSKDRFVPINYSGICLLSCV
jgi:hypothetical protein